MLVAFGRYLLSFQHTPRVFSTSLKHLLGNIRDAERISRYRMHRGNGIVSWVPSMTGHHGLSVTLNVALKENAAISHRIHTHFEMEN